VLVVGLGGEARELAVDVGAAGELAQVGAPGLDLAIFDERLGEVVEDERLPRVAIDEEGHRLELRRPEHQIVAEVVGLEQEHAAVQGLARHRVQVVAGAHPVAQPLELRVLGVAIEQRADVGLGER
jgi:hypothetical protein